MNKKTYLAPAAEPLVVRFEGVICQSSLDVDFGDQMGNGGNGIGDALLDDWGLISF